MNNDPIVFELSIAKNKPHSYRKDKPKVKVCPFCDTEHLTDIYRQDGEFIWLHNKFPTLRDTTQTVLIESHDHLGDISTYSKEHNRKLMRFALDAYLEMAKDKQYRSVVWYKNYGPHSGGSLIHPHMQIVGFKKEDAYKYLHQNNFEGHSLFKNDQVEVNIATHPVQGYTEININALELSDLDLWADWIQAGAEYLLNVMYNGRFKSYNLFFYPRADGGICAKYITRYDAPPYFVGYKLSQVNDDEALVKEAKRFREFFEQNKKTSLS
ncbi:galactose-1-phosphate uridylyltransferase [Lactobacillus pasteurii DSM 23907 = CRBIP 24.76]|uniref:Galactose-1-phosphate uridylyltransferase n=1 Tax=Lactobacillus pasteurii DSM 23907 = CRBIP 24.76 TaxID=1423790 RepID=I7JX49_9LACO|nr:DUF4931 domain-containing protein [Lactobacillus pasteurii]KRK07872.1 galactose-1-phosphate uridylyltransferase [Lactobacillus pasteurii DSM 23907 = CRBIP 24.76]TDG77962.1 hypothetical protein C5L33_001767 [Lactobacillus pasteurii]CCI84360.1 Galactose-1-phosphate uridylyltransferase [Lactobacillus pasteurii DSM 23907 = CRBIP 24.76]